jgi:hypothetical protein
MVPLNDGTSLRPFRTAAFDTLGEGGVHLVSHPDSCSALDTAMLHRPEIDTGPKDAIGYSLKFCESIQASNSRGSKRTAPPKRMQGIPLFT